MVRKILSPATARAVDILGSQNALARAIGVKQGHVWDWLYRNGKPAADRCIDIETATHGQVTRYDLRPDVFGSAPTQDV